MTEPRPGSNRFEAFDGLRAIAALLVIAYHASLAEGVTRFGALAPLASELKGGVTVFFVISGFLLYLPYARAIREGDRLPDWRVYARRRVGRILPGYWFALTVLGLAAVAPWVFGGGWWRYYGLAQIYSKDSLPGGLGVAWSLCVEATFYITLPFFARWMASRVRRDGQLSAARSQLAVLGAIGLFGILLRAAVCRSFLAPVPGGGLVLETALPGALDWFAIGMALAVVAATWEVQPERFTFLGRLAGHGGLSWALAAACFTAGVWEQRGDLFLPLYGVWTHVALGLASAFLVLPAVARNPRARPVRLLSLPFAAWLGMVSYGIYLWHDSLLVMFHGSITPTHQGAQVGAAIVLFLVVAAGAIAAGAASWYLVERPAQRLIGRARARSRVAAEQSLGLTRT